MQRREGHREGVRRYHSRYGILIERITLSVLAQIACQGRVHQEPGTNHDTERTTSFLPTKPGHRGTKASTHQAFVPWGVCSVFDVFTGPSEYLPSIDSLLM